MCMAQVLQGMVFVWGQSSPNAAAEAAAMPVPGVPDMAMTEDIPSSTSQGVPTLAFLPVSHLFNHSNLMQASQ